MHLTESIHFTTIIVRSGGDGAHSSQKHGAFLCSEVSFLERLAGGKTLFRVYRHWRYFITSLFTWSIKKKKKKTGRQQLQSPTSHLVLWSVISAIRSSRRITKEKQTKKRNIRRFKFSWKLRSDRRKHGHLWLFSGAWEMPCGPRT